VPTPEPADGFLSGASAQDPFLLSFEFCCSYWRIIVEWSMLNRLWAEDIWSPIFSMDHWVFQYGSLGMLILNPVVCLYPLVFFLLYMVTYSTNIRKKKHILALKRRSWISHCFFCIELIILLACPKMHSGTWVLMNPVTYRPQNSYFQHAKKIRNFVAGRGRTYVCVCRFHIQIWKYVA
jgi:uncharacterized membrane protein